MSSAIDAVSDRCPLRFDHSVVAVIKSLRNSRFVENVALESGGGAYFANSVAPSQITAATFSHNVASFGGGLALRSCRKIIVGGLKGAESCRVHENVALTGGALHLESADSQIENYEVGICSVVFFPSRNVTRSDPKY